MSVGGGGGGRRGPAEITRLHQANINTEIVLGANPWLANDPITLERLATSGADPIELASNAGAIAGMETLGSMGTALSSMSEVGQRAAYAKLTEQQQRGLAQMGYQPPEHKKGFLDDTIFESAWDITTDVVSTAMRPVGFVAAPIAGRALDTLAWIGDVPGHFYRAIRQMEGWQQWLAAGAAIGAMVALPFAAPALMAGLSGTLMTAGAFGAAGLGAATLATLPTAVQNPTEWWDMMNPWGRTGVRRGERIFLPEGQKKAREILGNAEHLDAIARDIAANLDMEDLAHDFAGVQNASNINVMVGSIERVAKQMADPGTPEFQKIYAGLASLVEQPEFVQAVDALQTSKISFGRDVASAFMLDPGDRFYGVVSGAADALWLMSMDPTMALGKLGKLQQLRRRGLELPGSVDDAMANMTRMVNEDAVVGATVDQVLTAVNSGRYSQMPKAWRGLYQPMQEWKRSLNTYGELTEGMTRKDFLTYMEHGKGMQRVMEGKGTVRGLESVVVSGVNKNKGWGRFQESIKDFQQGLTDETGFKKLEEYAKRAGVEVDYAKQLPTNPLDEAVEAGWEYRALDNPITETRGYKAGKAVGTGLVHIPGGRTFGDFISSISTMTPAGKAIKLTPASVNDMRDMGEDIPRFIETMGRHMGMNSRARMEWLDQTMSQGTVAQRRQVLTSFMDNLFEITGTKATDAGSKLVDDYIRHWNQAYALGGADIMSMHNMGRAVRGVLPDQHQAVYMQMPDLRELYKIQRQGHVLKNVLQITDNNFAETLMSRAIKPGWLLRIGFIPRAAGEEMLAFWMRMSEGGLFHEFAARRVGEVNEFRRARFALIQADGKINKLSRYEQEALRRGLPGHLRPLERMGERNGWLDPDQTMLSKWLNWNHEFRQGGISGILGVDDFLAGKPEWAKQLIRGRDHSIREMVLNGVDPDYVEAAERWMRSHADNVMRATSANNASLFEKSVVSPDVQTQLVQDPDTGEAIEMLVTVKGERVRIAADDPRFANAIMHRAGEWMDDRVVAEWVADVFSRTLPKFDGIAGRENVAEALSAITQHSDNFQMRSMLGELLQPRQDNWMAAADVMEDNIPEVADVMRRVARKGELNVHALMEELTSKIGEMNASGVGVMDPGRVNMLIRSREKLKEMAPIIDGLEALTPTERAWFSQAMTRQMLSEGKAFDIDAVTRWAGGDIDTAPKLVYYRGVPDETTLRINPDGSLTLMPQTQTQWGDVKAVSMSTDRDRSLRQYANRRGDGKVASGALVELDGEYINAINNTSLEALQRNPTTYRHTRYEGDGLYLLGKDDLSNEPFSEIAWATEAEVTIPAGKWKISDRDEYETLLAQGGGINVDDFKVKGYHFDEIAQPTTSAVDEFVASLTPEEETLLKQLFTEQLDATKQFNNDRWLNPNLTAPEPVLGSEILSGKWDDLADENLNILQQKVIDLMNREVKPGVTVRETLLAAAEAVPSDARAHSLDDVFREKMGFSGGDLFRRNDQFNQVHVLDKQGDRSQINSLLEDGWGLRGHGGWENLANTRQWSPFYESFEDAREALINSIAANLAKPQNQQWVKQSDWLASTVDGTPVVRPPADGLTNVYTPVVPPQSSRIDAILDDVDATPSEFPADRAIAANLRTLTENQPDVLPGEVIDMFGPARVDPVTGETVLRIQDPEMREAFLELEEFLVSLDPAAPLSEGDLDLVRNLVDEFTLKDESLDAAVRRLLDRPVQWEFHDPVIDALSDDEKFQLLRRVIADYRAGRVEYAQGTSQALHHIGFDDPRIAKWVSSLLADNADQAQRVGRLEVGRLNLTDSGAGRDGIRLVNANEQAGRAWHLDNRYRARAIATDAPAFHHVPTEVQKYKLGNGVEVERTFDVMIGKSQEEALSEWAERIADHILTSNRRGVRESQIALPNVENRVARRVNDRYETLAPGEKVNIKEDYFLVDEKGQVKETVDWGSNEYFDHEIDSFEDELMWNITGPMLRDHYEHVAGMGRKVPKEFRQQKGWLEGKARKAVDLDKPLMTDTQVNMRRSRVDDVALEPSASLPNVALAQKFQVHNQNVWDKIVSTGFNKVIGPMLDSLARKPMSFHYYAAAFKQNKKNLSWLLNNDLFEIQFADEFVDAIRVIEGEATLATEKLDDARLLAREAYNVNLAGAPDVEVQQWITTIAADQAEFDDALKALHKEYRSKAMSQAAAKRPDLDAEFLAEYVGEFADDMPAARVAAAAESLRSVNRGALKISIPHNTIGGETPAQRLVAAYHTTVPNDIWDKGHDAVTAWLRNKNTGLPSNLSPSQWRVLKDARNNMAHIFDTADQVASIRAIENVAPFLDSHEQRTMFATYGKNMLPFWYAEENFIKRWARTLSLGQFATPFGPVASGGLDQLRKAQLTYMGIKSAGIIRSDNNGQDWIVYPGSQLLTKAVSKIPGLGDTLPVGVQFQARTDSLLPGINPEGNVGVNPFAGVAASAVLHFFPDGNDMKRALLGDIGSTKSVIEQFIPTTISNAWRAAFGDEDSAQRYASAMMQAIAFMEAEGKGLPDSATPAELDEYLDKVRNHARIIMTSQMLAGFVVPGAPSAIATGDDGLIPGFGIEDPRAITSTMYRELISSLGIEEGTKRFLALYPQADMEDVINPYAFTQSATQSVSGAPLPATKHGLAWYDSNREWVDALPEAGAWFMPPDEDDEGFHYEAYAQQVASGLRKRRSPQEYIEAIKYRQGADTYFEVKGYVDEKLAQMSNNVEGKRMVQQRWDMWKAEFLAAHPIFAEQIQSGDARIRRDRTVQQLRQATFDPARPDSPQFDGIKEMVETYDVYRAAYEQFSAKTDADSRAKVRQLKDNFESWATAWTLRYPQLERLWTSVYRIEANIT